MGRAILCARSAWGGPEAPRPRRPLLGPSGPAGGGEQEQPHHYFRDKADLLTAVVAHQADRLLATQQLQLQALDGRGAIRAWFEATAAADRMAGL